MESIRAEKLAAKEKPVLRGQAAEFLNWGIYLVILGIVLAVGSLILTNFQTTGGIAANSVAANTLGYANTALATVAQYLPLVALVVVASGIIMLVVRAFTGGVMGGRGRQI